MVGVLGVCGVVGVVAVVGVEAAPEVKDEGPDSCALQRVESFPRLAGNHLDPHVADLAWSGLGFRDRDTV